MKKIYKSISLFISALAICGSVNAQVFFTEDFEGTMDGGTNLPTNWSETGLSTDGIWSTGDTSMANSQYFTYPAPPSGDASVIAYTNDDACNCDKASDRLILPTQDFTGKAGVQLILDYYLNNSAGDTASVAVSVDGGTTWTPVATLTAGAWQDDAIISLNNYANQSGIDISILYYDAAAWGYGMAVDDVRLNEVTSTDDLDLVGSYQEYSAIPLNQVGAIDLIADVFNNGAAPVTDAVVLSEIYSDADGFTNPLYSNTSSATAITNGTTENFNNGSFTPTTAGTYAILHQTSSSSIMDNNPNNDFKLSYFTVTDSLYSRNYALISGNISGALGVNAGTSGILGSTFNLNNDDSLHYVRAYFQGLTATDSVAAHVYSTSGAAPNALLFSSDTVVAAGGETVVDFVFGAEALGLTAGNYFIGIENFVGGANMQLLYADSLTYGIQDAHYANINGGAFTELNGLGFDVSMFISPYFYSAPVSCNLAMGNITSTDATTNGGNDGTATANVTGDQGTVTYLWSDAQTTQTAVGLMAGTYSVTATDDIVAGCSVTGMVTVSEPVAGCTLALVNTSSTDVTTNGGNDGTATVNVSGSQGTLTYTWSDGQTSAIATGLMAATYSVTVTDDVLAGCTVTDMVTVSEPSINCTLAPDTIFADDLNGTADVIVAGSQGNLSFIWSNGQTSSGATGLVNGVYTVTVTDDITTNCTITDMVTITAPICDLSTTVTLDYEDLCWEGGAASVSVTGGTSAYNYLWNTGEPYDQTYAEHGNWYYVTVTDFSLTNCSVIDSIFMTGSDGIDSAIVSKVDATCGAMDGSASVTVVGGQTPYTYQWYDANGPIAGATTSALNNLSAGVYYAGYEDANGCGEGELVTIENPGAPVITTITYTEEACYNDNDISATITASGGTGVLTYTWAMIDTNLVYTGSTVNNIPSGDYIIEVEDDNGCIASDYIWIEGAEHFEVEVYGNAPTCSGGTDGYAYADTYGGAGNFTYEWSTGETSLSLNNTTEGTYSVTVTDANGCMVSDDSTFTAANPVIATVSVSDASCGNSDGSATVTASGGASNYSFNWEGGQTSMNATGLIADVYDVTVTDQNGCFTIESFVVSNSNGPSVSVTSMDVTCNGDADGSITLTGGATSYSYAWSNGALTASISGLSGGQYDVVISDAGCDAYESVVIVENDAVAVTASSTDETVAGANDGTATAVATGGDGNITYNWGSATGASINGLAPNTYIVTATDGNGCYSTAMVTVDAGSASVSCTLAITATANDAGCFGDMDGMATVAVSGDQSTITYAWSNSGNTATISGIGAGTYTVTVTDAIAVGCSETTSVVVSSNPVIMLTVTTANETCVGANDGTASVVATGGASNFTYAWSNGDMTDSADSLAAGNVSVTVTDGNNCTSASGNVVESDSCSIGINELALETVNIYPNPSNGRFIIELGTDELTSIQIMDITGKVILAKNTTAIKEEITLNNATGVYFVRLQTGDFITTKKVTITK